MDMPKCASDLIQLFKVTFTASEDAKEEGVLRRKLVRRILSYTSATGVYVALAEEGSTLFGGGCFFTRLTYDNDSRKVFYWFMAVTPEQHGKGTGQQLFYAMV